MSTEPHRFSDEWLVPIIGRLPGIKAETIARWRAERRPFLSQAIVQAGLAPFETVAELVRQAFRIGHATLNELPDKATLALVPEKIVRRHRVLPLRAEPKKLELAMENPLDEEAMQVTRWAANREVIPLYCPPERLDELLRGQTSAEAVIFNLLDRIKSPAKVEVLGVVGDEMLTSDQAEVRAPVIQLVNAIIADAVTRRASDIHIEHDETSTAVRYRVDGLLRSVMVLPRYVGAGPVVSRVKIMARLDVSDHLRPQDGRAKLRVGDEEVALRVSTLPTRVGEKLVLRILRESSVAVSLEALGIAPELLERMRRLIKRKQGLFLVTGPTGSGKTTTLYAALNARRGEAINIVTVEDPIEYKLAGINQVQVQEKQGLTFASVLRSVLRQDPDVVLVGEIRDQETAMIAIQAAMTGHLVLSTLHTNDAVSAVTRLRDMGVEPFKIAAALIGTTAQRLVRRACPACAAPAAPDELSAVVRDALTDAAIPLRHVRCPGCETCGFTGFAGRFPLVELLEITTGVRTAITEGASHEQIRDLADTDGGLVTLEREGLYHLANGDTTQEELLPNLDEERLRVMAGVARLTRTASPVKRERATPRVQVPQDVAAPTGLITLLVIADPERREALATFLAAAGKQVHAVGDGALALAVAAKERPTLLIADLDLPGLDGLQVVKTTRSVLEIDLTAVLLVTRDKVALQQELLAQGATDVVELPAGLDEILERARAAVDRRHGWSATSEVMHPPAPFDEEARLAELRGLNLLNTPPEERFDRITRAAQERLGVPIAMVSLVDRDRQWFKSKQGTTADGSPREVSFCGHAINSSGLFIVPDAALDPRFAENPFVTGETGVRFYAGCPVKGPQGHTVGMLCILDRKPRELSAEEEQALGELGRQVEAELRKEE